MHVRFIEMMPIGMGTQFAFVKEDALKHVLEEAFELLTRAGTWRKLACHYFAVPGFPGTDRFYQRGQP